MKKLDRTKSQINRDVFKMLRGRTARRRWQLIGEKLREVHTNEQI